MSIMLRTSAIFVLKEKLLSSYLMPGVVSFDSAGPDLHIDLFILGSFPSKDILLYHSTLQ